MISAQSRPVAHLTFFLRILLYVIAATLDMRLIQQPVGLWVIVGVVCTWIVDFATGGTLWLSARKTMAAVYILFALLLAGLAYRSESFTVSSAITALLLTLALSSDAIVNSTRWKFLLAALIVAAGSPLLTASLQRTTGDAQSPAWIYLLIPVLAILARYLFPRTMHLIHTSLDYGFARVEVLSMGMKRVAAVGVRRNTARL